MERWWPQWRRKARFARGSDPACFRGVRRRLDCEGWHAASEPPKSAIFAKTRFEPRMSGSPQGKNRILPNNLLFRSRPTSRSIAFLREVDPVRARKRLKTKEKSLGSDSIRTEALINNTGFPLLVATFLCHLHKKLPDFGMPMKRPTIFRD